MYAIFKRELKSYFSSPIGYVFLAAIYFYGGFYFSQLLQMQSTRIGLVFSAMFSIIMITIPLITMRLMSEEKRQKTDQLLFTSPVNLSGIVIGKYLAAFTLYFIGICSTIFYVFVLSTFTAPNWNSFLGNFLGIALVGAALISIGLFISALTENQIVAAIGSFGAMMFIFLFDSIAAKIPVEFIKDIFAQLSFTARYQDFIDGILDVSHILFFISIAVVFIFLTVRVLERKRWS